MKKFLISEEEKNRILGMHKDATKRHYLSEQTSPNTEQSGNIDKKTMYNQDLVKWNPYFPIKSEDLVNYANEVRQKKFDYSKSDNYNQNPNFKAIEKVMLIADPEGWKSASDSSYSKYGSMVGTNPGDAIGAIVDFVNKVRNATMAIVQKKFNGVENTNYPKDERNLSYYTGILNKMGITV
jgi:hypothetical protein